MLEMGEEDLEMEKRR